MTRLGVPPLAAATSVSAGPDVAGDPRWAAAVWLARRGGQIALDDLAATSSNATAHGAAAH